MTDSDTEEEQSRSKRAHKPSAKARDNAEILAGEEFVPLGSTSKWTADILKCLGVRFDIHKPFNLLDYLKQQDSPGELNIKMVYFWLKLLSL